METRGSLGLIIPSQSIKRSSHLTFSKEAVMEWRNHLPMADVGKTANKVFYAISDCNQVAIPIKDRFEILELFRTPVQFICQSLRKHYINQTRPLTDTQVTIAALAETLQTEMAKGYKLVLEQAKSQGGLSSENIAVTVERIFHYYDHILLRNYQLYSAPKENIWREIHLLYSLLESKKISSPNGLEQYKSIVLLAIFDPYRWRQTEQDMLHDACKTWQGYVDIVKTKPEENPSKIQFNLTDDNIPLVTSIQGTFTDTSRVLDLKKLIDHFKDLLKTLEPNELKIKIEHSSEPEYLVGSTSLKALISFFEAPRKRAFERTEKHVPVEVCVGLSSVHYFVSAGKSFIQNTETNTGAAEVEVSESIELSGISAAKMNTNHHLLHPCTMQNESLHGYCLTWEESKYPPIQAGEVIGLRINPEAATSPKRSTSTTTSDSKGVANMEVIEVSDALAAKNELKLAVETEESKPPEYVIHEGEFEIAMIRWLKHPANKELKLGIQKLSSHAKAGALQILKEGQASGYYLRCLILDDGVLTPILPFKTGSIAMLAENQMNPERVELKKLIHATSSYKIFEYAFLDRTSAETSAQEEQISPKVKEEKEKTKDNSGFEDIWSKL